MIYDLTVGGTSTDPYAGLDRFGRVIDSCWLQQFPASSSSSEEVTDVERVQYGYDRASNRLWRYNVVASEQHAGGNDELYAYDGLQRLIDMARGNLNEPRTAVDDASFSQNWQLDATGNWPGFWQLDVADPTQNLDQQRSANQANEISAIDRRYGANWASCTYDRAGNTTTFPQPVDPESGFDATFDAWNRLVQLSDGESAVATYAYDGFNWRTKKVSGGVTRHYYYSASWQVLEERLGTSPESADAERQFLWGRRYVDDLVLRDRDTDNNGSLDERLYALQDANWNVTAITDTSGAVQERYRYSPYGEPTFLEPDFEPREPNVSSYDWETLYTGRALDSESDLYYYRYRYYHTQLGRFVSRDPIGYGAGDNNLYGYVSGRPTNGIDPMGLWDLVKDSKTCIITLEMSWYLKWEGTWTDADKVAWKNVINEIINAQWGSRKIAAEALKSGAHYCGCCPKSKLKVNIAFYEHWWSFGCDYIVTVYSNSIRSGVSSSGYAYLDKSDVLPASNTHSVTGASYTQPTIAHEFGHMMGLNHPDYGMPGVIPNTRAEYEADAAALMGLGSEMRDSYWEPILERLRNETRSYCKWTLAR